MRTLVVVSAAAAVLLGGSLLAVWILTRDLPPGGPSEPAAAAVPTPPGVAAQAPPPASVDMSKAPLGGYALPPPVIVTDEPPPPPPPSSWEAVPLLSPRGRGGLGLDMEELQPRLSDCFTPRMEARYGGGAISAVKDSAPLEDEMTTILVLQVETSSSNLRIVDAPVESRGPASDGTLACAQAVLRGHTSPLAGLEPGKRYRMRFNLMP